jgi:hypothetical protein
MTEKSKKIRSQNQPGGSRQASVACHQPEDGDIRSKKTSLAVAGKQVPPATSQKMEIFEVKNQPGGSRQASAACHQPEDGDNRKKEISLAPASKEMLPATSQKPGIFEVFPAASWQQNPCHQPTAGSRQGKYEHAEVKDYLPCHGLAR